MNSLLALAQTAKCHTKHVHAALFRPAFALSSLGPKCKVNWANSTKDDVIEITSVQSSTAKCTDHP